MEFWMLKSLGIQMPLLDALVTVFSWNTNGIGLNWMLKAIFSKNTNGICLEKNSHHRILLEHKVLIANVQSQFFAKVEIHAWLTSKANTQALTS